MKKLLSKLLAHKAGIAMGLAVVGVGIVAVAATYDAKEYEEAKEEMPIDATKADKAWCFAKNHWRTGISIIGTVGLMALSHASMVKELAAVTGGFAVLSAKYDEIDGYFKKNHPKEYAEFKKKVNIENIKKAFTEHPEMTKEPEDNRNLYYEPWSCQLFRATSEEEKDARIFLNEQLFNTGEATLFDYLASFPSSSGIKLEDWMQHFGWYEGDTMYSDCCSYFGLFVKTDPKEEKIIFKGQEFEAFVVSYSHTPDLEPDMPTSDIVAIERQLEESYEATA